MKREILFRGLREDGLGWVEGDLMQNYIHHQGYLTIVQGGCIYYKVIPESVGQFTGLPDKNGVRIFDGDIIKFKTTRFHTKKQKEQKVAKPKWFKSPVLFHEGGFLINESTKISLDADEYDTFFCCCFGKNEYGDFIPEVIGNIYENPELLKHQQ